MTSYVSMLLNFSTGSQQAHCSKSPTNNPAAFQKDFIKSLQVNPHRSDPTQVWTHQTITPLHTV